MATARPFRPKLCRALPGGVAVLWLLASPGGASRLEEALSGRAWVEDPVRRFGPPQTLLGGRAILLDEAADPELKAALAGELRRLYGSLYGSGGWRAPFAEGEPLTIYLARKQGAGVRRMAARSLDRGRLVGPAVLLDASGLTASEVVREVGRQIALATLAGYSVSEDSFLTPAMAELLSAPAGEAPGEEAWILAAGLLVDFRRDPAGLGRLWVEEVAREAGGKAFLREVWERAAGGGEAPLPLLLRMLAETARQTEEGLLVRAAARLYLSLEAEATPSRLRLLDLESGALDASSPARLTVRHRSFLPETATQDTLVLEWPDDGGAGAAVVRYRDPALPPDVVFFRAGDRRAIPLSGVARVDWLIAGSESGGRDLRAPAYARRVSGEPFSGLEAHASADRGGPSLIWTTRSHAGLWGWAVFREEVLPDGRVARTGPEIVPSSESAAESFRYAFLDRSARPGTFYRYTVWAVTDEGLLARAFAATLETPE
ncbi:MAG: hypothetical protein WD451_14965 [Thermoanaerobaculia bacterium]